MMQQSIQYGCNYDWIMEQLGPIGKGLVGGDNRTGLFISMSDKTKEQIAFFTADRRIAHFINDNQRRFVIAASFSGTTGLVVFAKFFYQYFRDGVDLLRKEVGEIIWTWRSVLLVK
jgi:hypothetical protein